MPFFVGEHFAFKQLQIHANNWKWQWELMAKHYKSQVSCKQMAKRDLLQLTLICITLFLFWKRELRGDKKHAENIQLWLWAAILEHHLHRNWPFTQCEQLTIEAFIYTCTRTRKQHAQRAHTDNLSLIFHLALFSALVFASCSQGTLSLMMILSG